MDVFHIKLIMEKCFINKHIKKKFTNRFFISTTVSAKWADPPSSKSKKKKIMPD